MTLPIRVRQDVLWSLRRLAYPVPVVMDGAGVNALGIIRGLAAQGLRSLVVDHRPGALGFASSYATGLVCPDPGAASGEFSEFLLELGQALPQKGVLLITDDTYLAAVAQREDELARYYHSTFPSWRIVQRVMDKKAQIEAARAAGVAVPKTFFLDDVAPDNLDADALPWPAILKARFGKCLFRAVGRQVIVVNSLDEVQSGYLAFGRLGLMLQEIIPGGDEDLYTFGSCIGRSGEVLASLTGRKLWQRPAGFGTALVAESCPAPGLADQGLRLLRGLGFFGASQVEFKRDRQDGQYKLVEINARFWKWHGLATACGANVAHAAYCDALGQQFKPQVARGPRKVWLESWPAYALAALEARGRAGPEHRRHQSLRVPWVDGLLSWRDPVPALRYAQRVLGMVVSRALRGRNPAGTRAGSAAGGAVIGIGEAIARAGSAQDAAGDGEL